MTGEMEAAPGEGGGPGGPEPGGPAGPGVTVVAQNTAFEPTSIALPASQEASITFENRDPGIQHNIAIYRDETLAEELFNGDLITGVESTEYAVPPLEAGEYPFICIVHPTMTGTVSVA
jgi:plastocyanin